jgi:hypothetical protein
MIFETHIKHQLEFGNSKNVASPLLIDKINNLLK